MVDHLHLVLKPVRPHVQTHQSHLACAHSIPLWVHQNQSQPSNQTSWIHIINNTEPYCWLPSVCIFKLQEKQLASIYLLTPLHLHSHLHDKTYSPAGDLGKQLSVDEHLSHHINLPRDAPSNACQEWGLPRAWFIKTEQYMRLSAQRRCVNLAVAIWHVGIPFSYPISNHALCLCTST